MQISRHWRMNAKRYRLEGVRYSNGEVSLAERPLPYCPEVAVSMLGELVRVGLDDAPVGEGGHPESPI